MTASDAIGAPKKGCLDKAWKWAGFLLTASNRQSRFQSWSCSPFCLTRDTALIMWSLPTWLGAGNKELCLCSTDYRKTNSGKHLSGFAKTWKGCQGVGDFSLCGFVVQRGAGALRELLQRRTIVSNYFFETLTFTFTSLFYSQTSNPKPSHQRANRSNLRKCQQIGNKENCSREKTNTRSGGILGGASNYTTG